MKVKENILIEKSIDFAARIIKLQRYLMKGKKESVISKQIVRSGTSIGANINETKLKYLNGSAFLKILVRYDCTGILYCIPENIKKKDM